MMLRFLNYAMAALNLGIIVILLWPEGKYQMAVITPARNTITTLGESSLDESEKIQSINSINRLINAYQNQKNSARWVSGIALVLCSISAWAFVLNAHRLSKSPIGA